MVKLSVTIKRNETSAIFCGSEVLSELGKYLEQTTGKIFILVDENTRAHCLPLLLRSVSNPGELHILEIQSGESAKSADTVIRLWTELTEFHAERSSVMINLGGGVITDLGGFVAATFKRGIRFIHIPTSLIGQVDAAVGGKTAINFSKIKNLAGTFTLPWAVFICPEFLFTLGGSHIHSGFAEMLKYGLIADPALWNKLIKINPSGLGTEILRSSAWEKNIIRCVNIKKRIVLKDFTEKGYRRILNFGHTIGHALETHFSLTKNHEITHGHAIALGMVCETFLSEKYSGLERNLRGTICGELLKYFPPIPLTKTEHNHILDLIRHDKKNDADTFNFTLLQQPGKALINCKCTPSMILESLDFYSGLTS